MRHVAQGMVLRAVADWELSVTESSKIFETSTAFLRATKKREVHKNRAFRFRNQLFMRENLSCIFQITRKERGRNGNRKKHAKPQIKAFARNIQHHEVVGSGETSRNHAHSACAQIHYLQSKHDFALHSQGESAVKNMNSKMKAKRIVARHTRHGLNKSMAKQQQVIASLGTERSYVQALSNYLRWCDFNDAPQDHFANIQILTEFLEERSELVAQKTLDQERQALQLIYKQKLPCVRSKKTTIPEKRSYTFDQVRVISNYQNDKNSLTTLLAFSAGLRAHEAATILPVEERPPSAHRSWDQRRFVGCPDYRLYTVVGKGGLVREVAVPVWLAKKLEARRIHPRRVTDRGIHYLSQYDVGFGQAWSQSFSSSSKKTLGFSTGAHGLRHSYAKWRLNILIEELKVTNLGLGQDQIIQDALLILSQELGHFRLDIVFCYLR